MDVRQFTPKPEPVKSEQAERLINIALTGLGISREAFIDEAARYMAYVAWRDSGATGLPSWNELPPMARERYRQHAERACRMLDSEAKLRAMKDAIESTQNWLNEPGGSTPEMGDILLHVLMDFDYISGKAVNRG